MTRVSLAVALAFSVLWACSGEEQDSPTELPRAPDSGGAPSTPETGSVDSCPDGFPRGKASDSRLVAKLSPSPEGVAVCPNGNVFVSIPDQGTVLRIPLDGTPPEVWATLTGRQTLGLACTEGTLFAVDFRSNDAAVIRIAGKGAAGEPLPNLEDGGSFRAMNGIVAMKGRGLYVSEASNTANGRIIFFSETAPNTYKATVAKGGLPFPNGLAFDSKSGTLHVALTLRSQVLAFATEADGGVGTGDVVWSGTPLIDSIDGMAIDENKAIYVAHYLQGYVGRSPDNAKVATMKEPRSLAFRGGSLLVTGAEGLYEKPLGICGM
ncbi:SMP-30/gluconolactonase/LRE family protein [Pendulispora brunnea]|uniref:SMP-30/gluconolactonase/LRE family protein n=1 Tax=Pendulispora brunnea TaxID=2905690 RepID=A0ABZ2K8A5_9BACT